MYNNKRGQRVVTNGDFLKRYPEEGNRRGAYFKNETQKQATTLNMLSWDHRRDKRHSTRWSLPEKQG